MTDGSVQCDALGEKSSVKWVRALRTGSGVKPPIAHSDASAITSHRSISMVDVLVAVDRRR